MDKSFTPTVASLLLALRRKLVERDQALALRNELPMTQFEVLWFISRSAPVSMDAIAEHLNIKPPSATAHISALERKGYVERVHNSNDRRVVNVVLTSSAKRQIISMKKRKGQIFESLISRLSVADRKEFIRILAILTKD